jgi:hypothetical protein
MAGTLAKHIKQFDTSWTRDRLPDPGELLVYPVSKLPVFAAHEHSSIIQLNSLLSGCFETRPL